MEKIILLLDGCIETTIEKFIESNSGDDLEPLTESIISNIKSLKVGESILVFFTEVKRIR